MAATRFHVLLNSRSGTAAGRGLDAAALQALFASAGLDATIDDRDGPSLDTRITEALASPADIIVAAGGDGTVTALADALAGTGKTLALLPLGTANLLARDLGIPLVLEEAIAALSGMTPRMIDMGEVNGRHFLHKVVIGLVPGLAAAREQLRGRSDAGARFGFLRFALRRIGRAKRLAVELSVPGGPSRIVRAQAVAVSNNLYDEGLAQFFSRQDLAAGKLGLHVIARLRLAEMLKLTAAMLLGRWRSSPAVTIDEVEAVTIRSARKRLAVMLDGEVMSLETPLSFRIRPGALSVLAPPQAADAAGAVVEAATVGP